MNADWHRKHPMPKNPTKEERIFWHLEHARECGCRDMPPSLREEVKALLGTGKLAN